MNTVDSIMKLADNYAQVTRWSNDGSSDEVRAALHTALQEFAAEKAGEPEAWRSAVLDLIDDCPGLTMEQDRWLSRRVKELDFASAPQPAQPEARILALSLSKQLHSTPFDQAHAAKQARRLSELLTSQPATKDCDG